MLAPLPPERWSPRTADHLLFRAGFGGSPSARAALYDLGRTQGVAAAVASLTDVAEDWAAFPKPAWVDDKTQSETYYDTQQSRGRYEYNQWWFAMLRGGRGVSGKVLKFFVDHLPVDWGTLQPNYARFPMVFRWLDTLRQRAGGPVGGDSARDHFKELVRDISWDSAMSRMLDLYASNKGAVNENFGRELLELFTLGVTGGYTEADVGAAAAAFTGRKIANGFPYDTFRTTNTSQIDRTAKTFLGQSLPAISSGDHGDAVLDVIFNNRNTARHLAWKLWRYFVSPNPSDALLDALRDRLHDVHQYRLRPFLKEIFLSEEFYAEENIGRMIKDPADLLVTTCNVLETATPGMATLSFMTQLAGQDILFPPSIAGWPEPVGDGNQWLSTGNMMARLNLPGYWSHGHYQLLDQNNTLTTYGENTNLPLPDLDAVAPAELRHPGNFPLLAETLRQRLLPFHSLRPAVLRGLHERYRKVLRESDQTEAVKDLLRVFLALPEFQMS